MGRLNKKLVLAKKATSSNSSSGKSLDMSQIQKMTSSDLISLRKSSKIPQESTDILMLSAKKLPEISLPMNTSNNNRRSSSQGHHLLSRQMKKTDKRKARKEFLLDKLAKGARKMKADKAALQREKRPVIGDLDPMKDTLEAIDKVLEKDESRRKQQRDKSKAKKKGITLKQKKRQYEFIRNASFFEAVKNHPEYAKNPFSAISTHIENKMADEHSSDQQ
ncbi:Neutral Sphingomyelinase_ putativelike [Caligus rogercresseyi]|uniref:Neutral Sphingomyelinase_ putativelike n=1 Tax=Caligus rogercresseyi TaxID=217165 RepID=A0A7T8JXN5_CALRO|nr:Neutral Sphingomyelinase_ putativelike [Caligus rogercresseyi]